MHTVRTTTRWISLAGTMLLLLFLASAPVALLVTSQKSTASSDASLQRARCQRIAKAVLVLQYRPVDERPQAVSELQNLLQPWLEEQESLRARPEQEIQAVLAASSGDYASITNALQAILVKPEGPVDAVQVSIVLAHEHAYSQGLNQVVLLLDQIRTEQRMRLVVAQLACVALLIAREILDQLYVRAHLKSHVS